MTALFGALFALQGEIRDEGNTHPIIVPLTPAGFRAFREFFEAHANERGVVQDAYLAATAEHLAWQYGLPVPSWVSGDKRKLHRPWFASPLAALRAILILESPAAFRARNLFVSANALNRA